MHTERLANAPLGERIRVNARKLRRLGPWYLLGRLHPARVGYGHLQGLRQRIQKSAGRALEARGESVFGEQDIAACVEALRGEGIHLGWNLPTPVVDALRAYACETPLSFRGSQPFYRSEVRGGFLPGGRRAAMGMAHAQEKPLLLERCPAAAQVALDPVLLEAVARYLRYRPRRIADLELFWNFVSDLPEREKLTQGSSIEYHYDIFGYHFVMATFYLTDTDRETGAHTLMRRSFKGKTLGMVLRGHQTDARIHEHFGAENELIIEGPAGTGFLENNACYHKATPPARADRLMLRIVYA